MHLAPADLHGEARRSVTTMPPSSTGGMGLMRAPWVSCTKFCRKIDMPIAEISGASRNEPRSGR
jgi:hypothetical protein